MSFKKTVTMFWTCKENVRKEKNGLRTRENTKEVKVYRKVNG